LSSPEAGLIRSWRFVKHIDLTIGKACDAASFTIAAPPATP
jgi:hypothetical protein